MKKLIFLVICILYGTTLFAHRYYIKDQSDIYIVVPDNNKVRDTHIEQDMYTPNWKLIGDELLKKEAEAKEFLKRLDKLYENGEISEEEYNRQFNAYFKPYIENKDDKNKETTVENPFFNGINLGYERMLNLDRSTFYIGYNLNVGGGNILDLQGE